MRVHGVITLAGYLTVKNFDVRKGQVLTQLLDISTTSVCDCGTATAIFSKVDSVLVGMVSAYLQKLLDEGNISTHNQDKFYAGVTAFYMLLFKL